MTDTTLPGEANQQHPTGTFRLPEDTPAARNKPILLAALSQRGARTATIAYVGSGDSGGIEDVTFDPPEESRLVGKETIKVLVRQSHFEGGQWHHTLVERELSIEQALRDFADEALELVHGGWEDGEGASGSIVFDTVSSTVRIEHASYFTDSDYTETEL